MLTFSPSNYLPLSPDPQGKLQASFQIANSSSSASAPFKIKCSRADLFKVRPSVGVVSPLQRLQVSVTSQHATSPHLAQQITRDIRFTVEYVLLDQPPEDLPQALLAISADASQTHKLYLTEHTPRDARDDDSSCTVRDEKEVIGLERFSPEELTAEERFEYLKQEIDRAEKERSEVIMAPRPAPKRNWAIIAVILIVMVLVGNAAGRQIGLRRETTANQPGRQKEYRYFGLEKLWAKEEKVDAEGPWWKFWN